jgi:Flp pilus assembly pilin Flp
MEARVSVGRLLLRFAGNASGATSLEYCFIATLISIVAVAAWTSIGDKTLAMYTSIIPGLSN